MSAKTPNYIPKCWERSVKGKYNVNFIRVIKKSSFNEHFPYITYGPNLLKNSLVTISCCLLRTYITFFMLHLFSCYFMFYSFLVALFSWSTLFGLHSFRVAVFPSVLHFFHLILVLVPPFFVLHSFHIAPFFVMHCSNFFVFYFFRVVLYCSFFVLHNLTVALFSCYTILMLHFFGVTLS